MSGECSVACVVSSSISRDSDETFNSLARVKFVRELLTHRLKEKRSLRKRSLFLFSKFHVTFSLLRVGEKRGRGEARGNPLSRDDSPLISRDKGGLAC